MPSASFAAPAWPPASSRGCSRPKPRSWPPIDFLSTLVQDELLRRQDRLLERRIKQAGFRDPGKTLDTFDFEFNKKMNRRLVFELATGRFVTQHEDGLLQGPPGTGKSHLAQAIGFAVIQQGHRVLYREAHILLEELADAQLAGTRKQYVAEVTAVPLLLIDDLGMRRLPHTAAEDLLEIVMRRYEKASTLITSNRPVEDWGKLLGDTAAVAARSAAPPCPRPDLRPQKLAHPAAGRLAPVMSRETVKPRATFGSGATLAMGGAIWVSPQIAGESDHRGLHHRLGHRVGDHRDRRGACPPGKNALQHIRP